jgi:hypothetical protein
MAKHLGEPGGENSATQILVVLSDFVTLLHDSLKKHDEREEEGNKRENDPAKKRMLKQVTPASVALSGCNPKDALFPPLSSLTNFGCSDMGKIQENSKEQVHSMKENITPCISKSKKYPESKLSTKKQYSIVERGGQKDLHITIVSNPQERTHSS